MTWLRTRALNNWCSRRVAAGRARLHLRFASAQPGLSPRTLKGAATSRPVLSGTAPGFTLVEMLAVLVIIGVLVGLVIPAVTNLMKSGGVSAASREVANTLNLARQYAITQRTYARVVFPYSGTGTQPDMWYRTYAVMTNRDNSTSASTSWAYLTKWEYLPLGAVFLDEAHSPGLPPNGALDDTSSLNLGTIGPSTTPGAMPFPTPGASSGGQLAYIEFGPTGAATSVPPNGTAPSTLAITEGFTTVSGGTAAPTPTTTKTSSNTLANVTTISADSLIGRVQVTRP